MKDGGVDRVKQQAAHVFVALPEDLRLLQGVDDGGVAAGEDHAHADVSVFFEQCFHCAHAGRVHEGDSGAVEDDGVELQRHLQASSCLSVARSPVYLLLLQGQGRRLLLRLFPPRQLQEGFHSHGSVEGLEENILVGVVERSLEAEDLHPRRRREVQVLLHVFVELAVVGSAEEGRLKSDQQTRL